MNDLNPYESPQHIEDIASKTSVPHTTSIRAEAWRGAKFGAKLTGIFFAVLMIVIWIIMISMWDQTARDRPGLILMVLYSILEIIAGSIGGAIIGAAIMTIAALIRKMSKI
jgi:hypothetical protein